MGTPSSSSASFALQLHHLMSLDSSWVALGQKGVNRVKVEEPGASQGRQPVVVGMKQKGKRDPLCSLCTHAPGASQLSTFSSPEPLRRAVMRSLLQLQAHEARDLIFCPVCRSAMTRMFNLREEVGDIETKIAVVIKHRKEDGSASGVGDKGTASEISPSLSSSSFRQLLSLDGPKIFVGRHPAVFKVEEGAVAGNVVVVVKREIGLGPAAPCSLCAHVLGAQAVSLVSGPDGDPTLRALLGTPGSDLGHLLCSLCRGVLTRLFARREELAEIESRIRAVVKLKIRRHQQQPSTSRTCDLCGKACKNQREFHTHVTKMYKARGRRGKVVAPPSVIPSHRPEGGRRLYSCPAPECSDLKFALKRSVERHLVRIHGFHIPSKLKVCPDCWKGFRSNARFNAFKTFATTRGVFKHMSKLHGLHYSKTKICSVCGMEFLNPVVFKAHTHPDEGDPSRVEYICPDCGKPLSTPWILHFHKRQFHLRTEAGVRPTCGKTFNTKESLQRHRRACVVPREEQRKCDSCGKDFASVADRFEHERVAHKGLPSRKCYFCSKTPSQGHNLAGHMRSHTLERPFVCGKCGADFRESGPLKKHVRKNVCGSSSDPPRIPSFEEEKPRPVFRCPECGKAFTRKRRVTEHRATIHGIHVPGSNFCPICRKTFVSRAVFEAHSHPDKGDPSSVTYTCPLCPKSFTTANILLHHKNHVHLKKYREECPTCGTVFTTKQGFQSHKLSCGVPEEEQRNCGCGQSFASLAERLDHERVVHGGLPSRKCFFCSKLLAAKSDLCRHMRTHTLKRPYSCDRCGQDFADAGTLNNHSVSVCGRYEEGSRGRAIKYSRLRKAKVT